MGPTMGLDTEAAVEQMQNSRKENKTKTGD